MILTKDKLSLGLVLGAIGPLLGFIIFKLIKFKVFTLKETVQYMIYEPGLKTLSVAMSLALLVNAVLFTLYINSRKDRTAKGIFYFTVLYGIIILIMKFTSPVP